MIKKAMVLAAGKGTRLGGLTQKTPKPLIDLGGTTPLYLALKSLEKAGITKAVINCHWLANQIIKQVSHWQESKAFKMELVLSYEDTLLETAGGIKNVIDEFNDEPFIIMNADIVWQGVVSEFISQLITAFNPQEMDFLLGLTSSCYSSKQKGDFIMDEAGHLREMAEGEVSNLSYPGLAVAQPYMFKIMKAGFVPLYNVWLASMDRQRLYGLPYDCAWVDMGTLEGLEKAKKAVQKKLSA